MPLIAPSLLACNFLKLGEACQMLNTSDADWFHLDVMDGRFVPNISFGLPVVQYIRTATSKTCDVHLMIEEPEHYAAAFKKAGADRLTIHYEACRHLHRNIQQIKELGMIPGVALNPHTPVQLLNDILPDLGLVLIMSVNPGFGGQQFIPNTLRKIDTLKNKIIQLNLDILIEVDGGISLDNAQSVIDAGADVLVAGTSIFNTENPLETIGEFKKVHYPQTARHFNI